MDPPLVSIVTPSYNQGPFLEETIQSVLSQSYPRIEYLVIDGGSTDTSVEIIRRYAEHLAFWVSERDQGQSHAINKGLRRTTGTIVGWLNSDDTLMPDALSRIVNSFEGESTVVHGAVRLIDVQSAPISRPKLSKRKREFGLNTIVDDGLVNQPGTFWHRAMMERVGYLDESLNYIMDYDLWVRMALAGAEFKRLADPPLATYRLSTDTKTVAGMSKMGLEKLAVLDRLMADPELPRKMGVPRTEVQRKARRARALASLKVSRGYFYQPGYHREALRWLIRAAFLHPPSLLLFPEYFVRRSYMAIETRLGRDAPSW